MSIKRLGPAALAGAIVLGLATLAVSCAYCVINLFSETDITEEETRAGVTEWAAATGVTLQGQSCRNYTYSAHCDVTVRHSDGRSEIVALTCTVHSGEPGKRWRRCEIAR